MGTAHHLQTQLNENGLPFIIQTVPLNEILPSETNDRCTLVLCTDPKIGLVYPALHSSGDRVSE